MNLRDEFFKLVLANLEKKNYDEYMRLCYNILIMFPDEAINYDLQKADIKIASIASMIKHFESKEEYEKCQRLKELIDALES
jgi:predicted sugar kinase